METRVTHGSAGIQAAGALLRAGEVVAFPTETVYGLGADATRGDAIRKIYATKGRPSHNPLIVHVTGIDQAQAVNGLLPKNARRVAEALWPGPLTLVIPRGGHICPEVAAGGPTVALRAPAHPVAQQLLAAANVPVAAPSANISGHTSPTTAQHVWDELHGKIPLILDGGPCAVGLESTVAEVGEDRIRILRPGAVTLEHILDILGNFKGSINPAQMPAASGQPLASPGLLDRHYAPDSSTFLFDPAQWDAVRAYLREQGPGFTATLISYSADIRLPAPHRTFMLPNDDAGYARGLYDALRTLDAMRPNAIFVLLPVNERGLWPAATDRLRRAGRYFHRKEMP